MLTAYGVFQGMRAAATVTWGSPSLAGRTVGVAGVGKVGHHLVRHLVEVGAIGGRHRREPAAVELVRDEFPAVQVVASTEALVASQLDVYAPCALGGAITDEVVEILSARRSSAARRTTSWRTRASRRRSRTAASVYAPDYCVNAGGLIQVADELEGFSFERAQQRATGIYDTTLMVLRARRVRRRTAAIAADRLAERRMREIGRLRGMWLPGLTSQFHTGLAFITGPPGRPLRAGASVIDMRGAMFGVIAALAALRERESTGKGQRVGSARFESAAFLRARTWAPSARRLNAQPVEEHGATVLLRAARRGRGRVGEVPTFAEAERLDPGTIPPGAPPRHPPGHRVARSPNSAGSSRGATSPMTMTAGDARLGRPLRDVFRALPSPPAGRRSGRAR